jgi:hypothetical protein
MSEFERFLTNVQALLNANTDEPVAAAASPQSAAANSSTPVAPAAMSVAPEASPVARDGAKRGDAIDAELARPTRTTATVSLKDSPEVEAFRNELIGGLIRVDTANQLLRLLNTAISRFLV